MIQLLVEQFFALKASVLTHLPVKHHCRCFRGKPRKNGKHWSAEPTFGFGERANFRVPVVESETALVIKDVSVMDEGVYR